MSVAYFIRRREQAVALSIHTNNNTREDWLRLQACLVILAQRRARR
jgi:hypothetical protein